MITKASHYFSARQVLDDFLINHSWINVGTNSLLASSTH